MAYATGEKAPGAFRTIGELSQELGVAQHILRYWETKFPQLRPVQRAGNRRYYRPADIELARRINHLLNSEGYTVRGVQQLLRTRSGAGAEPIAVPAAAAMPPANDAPSSSIEVSKLIELRDLLREALES
jgi:DNA-binding transcriptional MerR regulator